MARSRKVVSDFDVRLGKVVRSKRTKVGLTRAQLAELAGIPEANLKRREAGVNEITASELYRIAEVVGVSAAELAQEALDDYGGMQRLLDEHAPTSEDTDTLPDEGNVTYLGRVQPPLGAAADKNPRK